MAKIRLGMLAGTISGSQGNTTFSHGRYGAYIRMRTVPVKVTSTYAQQAKALLATASKLWGNLTTAQRLSWKTWAQTNPITDRLGDKRILDGHAAVTQLNINAFNAGSTTTIDDPPAVGAPFLPDGMAATYDIGAGNFQITWTGGALPADTVLFIWAAVTDNPGRSYVANLYKLVMVTAAAATSPQSPQTAIEARFGTLVVGQQVFFMLQTCDKTTGLVSGTYPLRGIVIST